MKGSVCMPLLLIFTFNMFKATGALECYSCEGGALTDCAHVGVQGWSEVCEGSNATCYEALVKYQNGALTLVQRRCFVPQNGKKTDFCSSFNNPNGKLGKCITCKTDLCNTDKNFWK